MIQGTATGVPRLKSPEAGADMAPERAAGALGARREGAVPRNNVQKFREAMLMSKAELARKAGLSTLTIDRVEAGRPCCLDTKRKILLALGLKVSDKDRVFGVAAFLGSEGPGPRPEAS